MDCSFHSTQLIAADTIIATATLPSLTPTVMETVPIVAEPVLVETHLSNSNNVEVLPAAQTNKVAAHSDNLHVRMASTGKQALDEAENPSVKKIRPT